MQPQPQPQQSPQIDPIIQQLQQLQLALHSQLQTQYVNQIGEIVQQIHQSQQKQQRKQQLQNIEQIWAQQQQNQQQLLNQQQLELFQQEIKRLQLSINFTDLIKVNCAHGEACTIFLCPFIHPEGKQCSCCKKTVKKFSVMDICHECDTDSTPKNGEKVCVTCHRVSIALRQYNGSSTQACSHCIQKIV